MVIVHDVQLSILAAGRPRFNVLKKRQLSRAPSASLTTRKRGCTHPENRLHFSLHLLAQGGLLAFGHASVTYGLQTLSLGIMQTHRAHPTSWYPFARGLFLQPFGSAWSGAGFAWGQTPSNETTNVVARRHSLEDAQVGFPILAMSFQRADRPLALLLPHSFR